MSFLKYDIPYELDSPERTVFHGKIIWEKVFLRRLYREWYDVLLKRKPQLPTGKVIEIGSGGGFLKELDPDVLCADVLDLPSNDLTFSALDMPFDNNEISSIFMIDTFHHIPDAGRFLSEVNRVLKKDGLLIMIEPANSLWGRFIYKNFHHEPFDVEGNWTIPSSGPLSGANGALPWIVFERDSDVFNSKFPNLKLQYLNYHTPFRYLLSGGVSFKSLVPGFSYGFFKLMDKCLSGISKQMSMFVTIVIRKV
ncbi:class I SAM-dependent methyltransferase [Maribellus maritimus]|uniref:class I SAM-dependent methyltransferase n=1 Tax=Maribellus maritimus TaxID=2870838 RepID=UPI001EEC5D18|nr:class I SAM-dependent methyltransferase [Maribellus maritimus]